MTTIRCSRVAAMVCLATVALAMPAASAVKWKPLDRADLAASKPVVQSDADAEAIFWDVRVTDELSMVALETRTVLEHYLRIKIFTERGRDAQSHVDIPHLSGVSISNVVGRTISRDGTIVELKKEDVFERTIVKAGGLRVNATSFVMPAVEVGSIIEYQWREVRADALAMYAQLECQRDIPVQLVRYLVKPLSVPGLDIGIRVEAFNGKNTAFAQDKDDRGFLITTMANVAAFKNEPQMLPEHDVKPWLLVYYTPGGKPYDPAQFWKGYGADLHNAAKSAWKVDGRIRTAAQSAAGELKSVGEKVDALLALCRTVRRTDLPERGKLPTFKKKTSPQSPGDVLSRKEGDADDMIALFGALAQAAGLDARLARTPDREEMVHPPNVSHAFFMTARAVAVRDGNAWRFVNPANAYGAPGALTAGQEGRMAIVGDPKEPLFAPTELSGPNFSRRRRTARLTLDHTGAIEGDVTLTYMGHLAEDVRQSDRLLTDDDRDKSVREFIQTRLPGAEVTAVRYEHLLDQDGDLAISAHVKAAGYAQRAGSRMFLAPAVFEQNAPAMFASATRQHPVNFAFAWTDEDRITFEVPDGFRIEPFGAPAGIQVPDVAGYSVTVLRPDDRTLQLNRNFSFGAGAHLEFPVSMYSAVKAFFDRAAEMDQFTITLREGTQP